jgi:HEAT repeat protein
MAAFARLSEKDVATETYRAMLLELLVRENRVIDSVNALGFGTSEKLGEGYSEYAARVAEACDRSCNRADPATIQALATTSYNPEGPFAERLARENGSQIIPFLMRRFRGGSPLSREAALRMLGTVHANNTRLTGDEIGLIHDVALEALGTSSPVEMRIAGIELLSRVGDARDIPALREIAARDKVEERRGSGVVFPVRSAAALALSRIKARSRPQVTR